MAALHDSGMKDPAAKRAGRRGGGEPKQKRARSLGVDAGGGEGSSTPATEPTSESRAASLLVDMTLEDPDALHCIGCCLPLKPPIFQCDVGHAVCSRCRDKLEATGKCPVCRVDTGRYRRCHIMERVVESIRVPCPYAAYGCALRPAYYDLESHRLVCPHASCHCPGEACSFVGSMTELLDHFSTTHKWPCITTVQPNDDYTSTISLHDGFNFLLADCSMGNESKGDTASVQCLLMLTVERQQLARFISVHWIDPDAAASSGSRGSRSSKEMECRLCYSRYRFSNNNLCKTIGLKADHYQASRFRVARTNFSSGLPKPDDCFQFVVPNSVVGVGDGIDIHVRVKLKYRFVWASLK